MSVIKHRFTVEEYHKMGEAGIFSEDDRVELVGGEIVEMAPIGDRHVECVIRLNRLLNRWLILESPSGFEGAAVSVQNPVALFADGEPQPDVALLRDRGGKTGVPDPEDVIFVVEVADTSLEYDRMVKLPLYARAGIPEAWLVDLRHDIVEVHADPGARGYGAVVRTGRGERVPSSVVRPQILTDEILP
jgi:Uma2 family endonuclease